MKILRTAISLQEDDSRVDLTPMLDVVFIMLIFFIVTASFVKELGLSVNAPGELTQSDDDIASITIVVEPGSVFRVNNRVTSKAGLRPYLHAVLAQNPGASIGVVVAPESRVADTVAAADAARMLGFAVVPITRM